MGRKNTPARRRTRCTLPVGFHLMYSTDEWGDGAAVVRYLGESDGDHIKVWHPEGYELWVHISHTWRPTKRLQAA